MAYKRKIPHYNLVGGLNLDSSSTQVNQSEALINRNCIYSENGGIGAVDQRDGFDHFTTVQAAEKIRNVGKYRRINTFEETFVVLHGKNISKIKPDGTLETLTSSLTNSDLPGTTAQLNNDFVICNGKDKPWFYNDGGIEQSKADFTPLWCFPFAKHMFYGGSAESPANIFNSEFGNARLITPKRDFLPIGDIECTGGFTLYNSAYFTTETSLYKLDGSNFKADDPGYDARLIQMEVDDGSVNFSSIIVVKNKAYFLGQYGIYSFDGNNTIRVSKQIHPILTNQLSREHIDKIVCYHDKEAQVIVWSIPQLSNSSNTLHLNYHYNITDENGIGRWSTSDGFEASCWYQPKEKDGFPIPFHGDSDGWISIHTGQVDDTNAAEAKVAVDFDYRQGWETIHLSKRNIMKHIIPTVKIDGTTTVTVSLFVNYEETPHTGFPKAISVSPLGTLWNSGALWNAFNWGSRTVTFMKSVGIAKKVARNWSVRIQHKELARRFRLVGWETVIIQKGLMSTK